MFNSHQSLILRAYILYFLFGEQLPHIQDGLAVGLRLVVKLRKPILLQFKITIYIYLILTIDVYSKTNIDSFLL